MSNMSYCMFQNTWRDLEDCYIKLHDKGGIKEAQSEANEHESYYMKELVQMCKNITEDFGGELED